MSLSLSFLSIGPRIANIEGKLVARTSLPVAIFTLGVCLRSVAVDPKRKKIVITRRALWFCKRRRTIPFRFIDSIYYRYNDLSTSSTWHGRSFDVFQVSLKLVDQEIVTLFNFAGRGGFVNNTIMPDWYYCSESAAAVTGTQDAESRLYVDMLQRMTGKPCSA